MLEFQGFDVIFFGNSLAFSVSDSLINVFLVVSGFPDTLRSIQTAPPIGLTNVGVALPKVSSNDHLLLLFLFMLLFIIPVAVYIVVIVLSSKSIICMLCQQHFVNSLLAHIQCIEACCCTCLVHGLLLFALAACFLVTFLQIKWCSKNTLSSGFLAAKPPSKSTNSVTQILSLSLAIVDFIFTKIVCKTVLKSPALQQPPSFGGLIIPDYYFQENKTL